MPIYEYQCDNCSYHFEVKQSIKEDPIATCQRCGKPVRRLISSPGILFKGSGWYVTDYSNKLKPPAAEADKTASTGAEKKDTTAGSSASTPAASPTTSSSPATTPSSSSTPASGSSNTNTSTK